MVSLFVCVNVWASTDSLSVAERNAQQGFNDTIDRLAPDFGYVALIAVGIQLVSSVQWAEKLSVFSGQNSEISLRQGEEIGSFLFGGSDIILLFEPGKAPIFEIDKSLKAGDLMA